MSDHAATAALIDRLAAGLQPVRRLSSPGAQVAAWLALVAGVGLIVAPMADFGQLRHRLETVPDMWLAALGSLLTAITAGYATIQTGRPDRSPHWAWLPAMPAALWIGASGAGCLRGWADGGAHPFLMEAMRHCFFFIVGVSVPLSAALVAMLRWACPLRPDLTAILAGLASAAAAATLLNLFHPFDAAATDLLVHAVAVAIVITTNRLLGSRLFGGA